MARIAYRFFLEHVHRSGTRTTGLETSDQRAWLNEPGATRIHEERGWLHPRQIGGGDHAASVGNQPHVQCDHITRAIEAFPAWSRSEERRVGKECKDRLTRDA